MSENDVVLAAVFDVRGGIAEVKGELVGFSNQLAQLTRQVQIQNGSVRELREWRTSVEQEQAREAGVAAGRAQVRTEDRARAAFVLRVLENEYVRLVLLATGIGMIARYWPW